MYYRRGHGKREGKVLHEPQTACKRGGMYSFISIHASNTHHPLYLPTFSPASSYAACIPRFRVRRRRNTVAAGASDWRRLDIELEYRRNRLCGFQERFLPAQKNHGFSRSLRLRSIDRSRSFNDGPRCNRYKSAVPMKIRFGCTNF